MRTDKEINNIIKKGLEDYARAETKSETANVKFSKEHEEKMKKMFNDMKKKNTAKAEADREIIIRIKFNLLTKVAIAAIVFAFFTTALSTGLKAWKEHKLKSYGGNEEYSWLLSNDTSEIYEQKKNEEAIEYVKNIFPGLSGEISDVEIIRYPKSQRIIFKYNQIELSLKIRQSVSEGVNDETEESMELNIHNMKVYYSSYDEKQFYRWNVDEINFDLSGKLPLEEGIEWIKMINYEKIETNF